MAIFSPKVAGVGTYSLPSQEGGGGFPYLAGYEGWRGRACVAGSTDGVHFANINSESDRRQDGLVAGAEVLYRSGGHGRRSERGAQASAPYGDACESDGGPVAGGRTDLPWSLLFHPASGSARRRG